MNSNFGENTLANYTKIENIGNVDLMRRQRNLRASL